MTVISKDEFIEIVGIAVDSILENEQYFCDLDSVAGDGDFGASLAKGFSEVKSKWKDLEKSNVGTFLRDCSMIIMEKCGGASGPIWGNAFLSASRASKGKESLEIADIAELFQAMVDGVQKVGKAELGDKTLLDALIPFKESLKESAKLNEPIEAAFEKAVTRAEEGAESTKTIVATKGRARYLGDRSIGAYDAGARAVAVILSDIQNRFFNKTK
ncbi:MAG: dihydroxyacetone kinase subunit DhaL [Mesotoga sp.]|uniref:dihydroxyacetone kinase subunit DhaL n=1 Tax=Mesotoga sp. TaxID=2053577 RepID=UPI0016B74B46|nr:dihydroxyacetone kinase subunit DhaL [Mesotoga sp.]MDD3681592.1 dihydroxyacetone kinase subunit DhaL [Mesotoga sp.]MDD4207937.1 dihydroxyacetone kinase subunit DhaL [Mesotoga sp.]MDD5683511.1 dihydroxyacetone kinase subunit DhaL [Mesotoga sp.]NLT45037.1 dihydroxyacetone kinase subunit L [Thermotogaceae bacterium]